MSTLSCALVTLYPAHPCAQPAGYNLSICLDSHSHSYPLFDPQRMCCLSSQLSVVQNALLTVSRRTT